MTNTIKRIDELRTGMILKFIDKQEYYVLYKNAVKTVLGYTDYLVEVEEESVWRSYLVDYSENESFRLLENTKIETIWIPRYPYYTRKTLLESLNDSKIIYQKDREVVEEMTMEEVCKLLGKNIKIVN